MKHFPHLRAILLGCAVLTIVIPPLLSSAQDQQSGNPEKPAGRDAPLWNPQAPQDQAPPTILKLGEGRFQLDNILISKPDGTISVTGEINLDEQRPVEYLACGPQGKLHECILRIDVSPIKLQIALLLLGLEPGNTPLPYQGAPGIPTGDPVAIMVSWSDGSNKTIEYRAEELLLSPATQKTMPRTSWIFTGSQIIDGRFMAAVEQSIVASYHDPYAMFDHPLESGTDDLMFTVNTGIVPPKGTPVTMTIKSLK